MMPKCKTCGKTTIFKFEYCKECNEKKKNAPPITKKEQKARDKATPQALKLHVALRGRGVHSFLELWDKHKHIDVAIPKYKINIEVDGGHHNTSPKQALADLKRTYYSYKKGYFTLRIPNSLVEKHFEECINLIVDMIKENKK